MTELKKTPLHALHGRLGAKMVPFAGYDMPVQFPMGVKKEHEHTRQQCGLFDVSHMGQVIVSGDNVAEALETLIPADLIGLAQGAQRYGLLTNNEGGILDDLMAVNAGDHFYLVVNAACKDQDIAHLRVNLGDHLTVERLDRGLLALQGPTAHRVMQRLCPAACELVFMQHGRFQVLDHEVWISRSGYTGEDGFEISVPADATETLAERLLSEPEVEAIGLGARDSLRLEAGLCLYGHDMDTTTTPVEAGLIWAISKPRRHGGERPGGFPGADLILHQVEAKDHSRKRVGLVADGRAPVREGALLVDEEGNEVGQVTSGGFGPSVGKPVAMGYVTRDAETPGTTVYAEVRGKRLPMTVSKTPFVTANFYRG
ncbi:MULTISPECIES: glycine cleavage system aminomethyltransferase GcvT [unclassified Halomonas]|uniref:glycine cleavage system aminomethyltransferase GcvT n=1 Tax=unclassified Halomonas TaxID=2609666 RepID=UPI0006DA5741|nr:MULTISPECIES: glycine cleavage system aminomethyltransferase GcvT [unclassified Halomonas]KPQ18936.1 MAG: aminomethyltransferase GcvT [Halomonas sp. HL-93]SBR48935.1 aminomethyltransferase [Halomonas sp. HL-93]SNY96035.1 aminomethyltransferase [Halomonas sp. hl-4]